jgi:heme exporter protein C
MLVAATMAGGLWLALSSPPDAVQGDFVRILYIHVPSAWLAFLAFGITAAGSLAWRMTRRQRFDDLAAASAEVGVLFTVITLLTGSIWGRPVWGVWWSWGDARLSTTALMLFVYLGYLALRRAVEDPERRARLASVLGLVAVVQVPLVYFSVNLWRTLHQTQTIRPDGPQMDPEMVAALLVNVAAFTLLYVALVAARLRVGRAEAVAAEANEGPAGAAVGVPRLGGEPDVS